MNIALLLYKADYSSESKSQLSMKTESDAFVQKICNGTCQISAILFIRFDPKKSLNL